MKLYLSSYELGDKRERIKELMPRNKKIAYIPNAGDYSNVDLERKNKRDTEDMQSLTEAGVIPELVDLREYFGKKEQLQKKIGGVGGVFVRGGNTFILRQAMRLSGFDIIITRLKADDSDFLYSGYSAGVCVLAPNMKSLQIVDDPTDMPYKECQETIWEGLGFLDFMILPHFDSDHPESADIDKEVEFCKQNNIPFKTLKDGEVIITE